MSINRVQITVNTIVDYEIYDNNTQVNIMLTLYCE